MNSSRPPRLAPLALTLLLAATAAPAATLHLADIVPLPTAINDLEDAPAGLIGNTWAQQGIRVSQVGGELNDIWTTSGLGNGSRSWYPDAGDDGWTRIRLTDGSNIGLISLLGGSGWITPPQHLYYELAHEGIVVLSGTMPASFAGSWFGFSGGDFDEVRLRSTQQRDTNSLTGCTPVPDFRCNYFWLDDVKIAPIPEPGTWVLMTMGLAALAAGLGLKCRPGARHAFVESTLRRPAQA